MVQEFQYKLNKDFAVRETDLYGAFIIQGGDAEAQGKKVAEIDWNFRAGVLEGKADCTTYTFNEGEDVRTAVILHRKDLSLPETIDENSAWELCMGYGIVGRRYGKNSADLRKLNRTIIDLERPGHIPEGFFLLRREI